MKRVAVIGGTALQDFVEENEHFKEDVVFLNRHNGMWKRSVPPHKIDYRANIRMLAELDITEIIAVFAVGSLSHEHKPGDIIIPDSFLDFTKNRESTFFDDEIHHQTMGKEIFHLPPSVFDIDAHIGGTYVCIEGPRFSTLAESKMFQKLGGTLVGMTMVPECVLAMEAGIKYTPLCIVTDYDCWIHDRNSRDVNVAPPEDVTYEMVQEVMAANEAKMIETVRVMLS